MSNSTTTETAGTAGAAADQGDESTTAPETTTADTVEDLEGTEHLGDPGKKALDAMKSRVKAAEDARRTAETERRALQDRLKALENAEADRNRSAEERAKESERRNAEQTATAKANQRLLKSEVRAAAAGKLKDPTDALKHLDLSSFDITDDGDTDQSQIEAAIAALIEAKPYLAVDTKPAFVRGDTSATKKQDAAGPKQLSRADLDGMSAAQIMAAQKAGQLDTILKSK